MNTDLERMDAISFYEIWDGEKFLCEIGITMSDTEETCQTEAERIAKLMSPSAEAVFDRCGEIYA